jgi:RNA polymerase sigma-70 factor, ECF subfamily
MQDVNTTLAPRYGDLMAPRAPSEHDAHLLARIAAGDDRALGVVYDEHTAVVYGVARRVTRNEHIARDVCQEVFAYLWEMPGRVDLTKGSLRAYLAMLAHRRAVDEVRRCERRTRAEGGALHPSEEEGPEVEVVDGAAAAWRDERLAEVLTQLPEAQLTALRLAYFDGLSYRQVAAALGIAEGTAKSRLRVALARLRTLLDADFRAAI